MRFRGIGYGRLSFRDLLGRDFVVPVGVVDSVIELGEPVPDRHESLAFLGLIVDHGLEPEDGLHLRVRTRDIGVPQVELVEDCGEMLVDCHCRPPSDFLKPQNNHAVTALAAGEERDVGVATTAATATATTVKAVATDAGVLFAVSAAALAAPRLSHA